MLKQRTMNLTGPLTMMNQRPFSSKHKLGGAGSAAEFALYLRTVFIQNFEDEDTVVCCRLLGLFERAIVKKKQN